MLIKAPLFKILYGDWFQWMHFNIYKMDKLLVSFMEE